MEDILTMSQKELKRLHIIRKAIEKRIRQREAAGLLGLSPRHVRRVVKRVRELGDKGIIHRSRGTVSHHATTAALKQKILNLCKGRYAGCNPTFASEKLFEKDKITISRETLRQWFIAAGIIYAKRKARPHRQWRERKGYCGEMVQMDGSHHDWFEGRAPRCVLMGYIDDASSRVYARFYANEGTMSAMESFKRYCLKYGLPVSIYLDRHAAYKAKGQATVEEELQGRGPTSQFERALEELGVRLIHAQSAQAKGRIERLFRTFQDRLIKEMRLAGIKSIAEANMFLKGYLPVFNKRFIVAPVHSEDLHRPLPKDIDLDTILSVKTSHVLRNDFTVVHEGKLYQVEDTLRTDTVVVEERLNGSFLITHKGRHLRYRQITQRPHQIPVKEKKSCVTRKTNIPAKDHPWRSFRLTGSPRFEAKEEVFADAL